MIILLHGFLGSPADWNPLTQYLQQPFKALTLPGHLGKPLDLSLLDKEIPDHSILVGYSLGGRLALYFARRFPKKVRSLILLSANPGIESERKERMVQDEKWISIIENEGMDRFVKKWYAQELFSSFSLTDKIRKNRENHDPKTLVEILRNLSPAKLPSLWSHLHTFSFPLLFLFGENDIQYQKIGKRLAEHHEVIWIPHASHPIHFEAPKTIAEIINRRSYDFSHRRKT